MIPPLGVESQPIPTCFSEPPSPPYTFCTLTCPEIMPLKNPYAGGKSSQFSTDYPTPSIYADPAAGLSSDPASRNHWIFKKTHRQRSAFQRGGVTARKEDEGGDLREQQIRFWSRLIMSSEGMAPHGQEGAYEQNPGGPSSAANSHFSELRFSTTKPDGQFRGCALSVKRFSRWIV
jgi:hypothetical protein